jgi:1,4-dihydroxy-2-naphthoate octaprenyltransferase
MKHSRDNVGDISVGVAVGLLGLIGLFMASRALDIEIYIFGLSLGIFAVVFIFGLVRRYCDERDAAHGDDRQEV